MPNLPPGLARRRQLQKEKNKPRGKIPNIPPELKTAIEEVIVSR